METKTFKELNQEPKVGMLVLVKGNQNALIHYIIEIKDMPTYVRVDGVFVSKPIKQAHLVNENGHINYVNYDRLVCGYVPIGKSKLNFKDLFEVSDEL